MRAVVIAVVSVAALLLTTGCRPAQEADGPADEATPTPTPTSTPAPGETEAEGETEDVAVVVDADGRVVLIDAATGEEIRELLDDVAVHDPASNDIAVSPDRSEVFVVAPPDEPSGDSRIMRVPVDGGEPEEIAQGTVPAVSPDGRTLAYVVVEASGEGPELPQAEPVLVLRDLDSGEETRLSREEPFFFIPDVEWTADGTQVVFTAGEIHTGLYAVDHDAENLDDARRLGPDLEEDETDETSWGPVAAFGPDRLAVVEVCCDLPREERWHVIGVDAADGSVQGQLVPEKRVEATHIDSDADGDLLIVVDGGPTGGQLLRWDGEGDLEEITDRVIVAAW